jgi:hypothetical protein
MHLRTVHPSFDRTRVDLTQFQPLRAKIDCITIRRPPVGISHAEIKAMQASIVGRLTRPNNQPNALTIHDPTLRCIRYLLANHPTDLVGNIEVAVDAHLPGGSNDLYLLRQLKEQFRHCVAPQRHTDFKRTSRNYWDLSKERHSPDAAANLAPLTTVTYKAKWTGMSVKLYLKTLDQSQRISQPYVRTELRMDVPSYAGLDHVADIPKFAKELRRYCASAFFIGNGFKDGDTGGAKWDKFGAAWSLDVGKGLVVRSDAVANRAFGDALNNLGRSLGRL